MVLKCCSNVLVERVSNISPIRVAYFAASSAKILQPAILDHRKKFTRSQFSYTRMPIDNAKKRSYLISWNF